MPRSRPRHDHDAGGPAELLAAKAELRQEVWAALKAVKATRFPGPDGRIPNFVGAEAAAEGTFVHVYVDNTDPTRPVVPIPEEIRAAVASLVR